MAGAFPSEASGSGQSRTFVRRFQVPPEAIWPLLSDTARFNEAAKLPKHTIEEIPRDDGSVQYIGRAKVGPFSIIWDDKPVNWVANRWFRHCRDMRTGPLRYLYAHLTLAREGEGCRAEYTVEAAAANILGRLMLATRFFPSTRDMFMGLAEDAERYATGASPMPFDYQAPPVEAAVAERVERLVAQIEASKRGHGLARRLADHVLQAQEVDLVRVRPLRLARDWDVAPQKLIELCLESARAGLLSLRWDLLCPRCRIGKAAVEALDELPEGAHCDTCNISYERDFSRNVEVAFAPAPQVRPIEAGEFCLFGPMNTPHIWLQLTLAAGARRVVEADLPPGPYRARTLEPGPEVDFEIESSGVPAIAVDVDSIQTGPASEAGTVVLENRSKLSKTLIVEELHWVRDALTADRVTAMQAFRDLFSDQVLRPGDEVSVGRVTLMFTDLRGSTALYSDVGDAAAYHLVREHFAFLAAIVRAHGGAVVKTIGDAIMAAFSDPADALRAALEAQREVEGFNRASEGQDLVIKLGLHEGPCIAVTLNGRLDYFGTSVNMAARLQAQSRGGDVVLSQEIFANPALGVLLDGMAVSEESVPLKGFAEPVSFCRVTV
jgi:class 3 adenylate cyclase